MTDTNAEVRRFMEESGLLDRMMPAQPRWRYYEHNGWLFGWSTERVYDGRFAAFIYRPTGADAHELVKELHFAKRATAKARAWQWCEATKAQASGRPPAKLLK